MAHCRLEWKAQPLLPPTHPAQQSGLQGLGWTLARPFASCVPVAKALRPLRPSVLISKNRNEKTHLTGPLSGEGELMHCTERVLCNRLFLSLARLFSLWHHPAPPVHSHSAISRLVPRYLRPVSVLPDWELLEARASYTPCRVGPFLCVLCSPSPCQLTYLTWQTPLQQRESMPRPLLLHALTEELGLSFHSCKPSRRCTSASLPPARHLPMSR